MNIGTPPFLAHFDPNKVPTITGVVGTLGTADQLGTARAMPIGVDPATGAAYVYNLGPAGTTTQTGTMQIIGLRHADEFATLVSSGTSTLGTIKGGVSGSAIYITGLVISVGSASNVVIASGGTSTPILGTLFFNANAGVVAMPFDPPIRTASGSALVYQQSTNGPITITVVGYVD